MASEHRIIRVNDLNPKRTRKKRYLRVYKGDVLRVSRTTTKPANKVIQEFGLGRNVNIPFVDANTIVIQPTVGHNKYLPPDNRGGGGTIPDVPIDGGPIEEVLARFPNPLQLEEIEAISTFVQQQIDAGNWDKYDSFYHFGLLDPVNTLTDWVVDGRTATNNGATHIPGLGYEFDGISSYIDSNYNPSVDGINLINEDINMGCYIKSVNPYIGMGLFGKEESANKLLLRDDAGTTIFYWVGSSQVGQFAGLFQPDSLYSLVRLDVNTPTLYKDGAQISSRASTFSGLPNANIPIGANELASGNEANFFEGTLSSFIAGASIGFDQAGYYNSLVEFNNSLEIESIIASFPGAFAPGEEEAIREFLTGQFASSNWDKVDSFAHFALSDPLNALWDWKRGIAMTNNGATFDANGAVFDGIASYIDSNYNPSVDGVNYTDNDAMIGTFIHTNDNEGTYEIIGVTSNSSTRILSRTNPLLEFSTNSATSSGLSVSGLYENSLAVSARTLSNLNTAYINGNSVGTDVDEFTLLPTTSIYLGARNSFNAPGVFFKGTLSSFIAGAAIGFDQIGYYNDLVTLNDSL